MDHETLTAKAEFYLTLSRAFMPPTQPDAYEAFVRILPDELADIARAAGYRVDAPIADYAAAAARIPDPLQLLQTYAGLFLMPPREVQLHVAVYLDGAILGGSADGLMQCYAGEGLGRSDDFHDLPDHLSVVLEFLALLYGKAAETDGYPQADLLDRAATLNRQYLLSWVPIMRRQLAKTLDECADRGHSPIYLQLATILQEALIADAGELSPALKQVLSPECVAETNRHDAKEMATCRECGADIAPAARVRRVRKVLEKEGIDTSHLELCPRCRGIDLSPMGLRPGD